MSTFDYDFEWDAVKAGSNFSKHGVPFEVAATVFLDSLAMSRYDPTHSATEERWITSGVAADGQLLVVAHTSVIDTLQRMRIRIISARQATKRERRAYEEGSR